MHIPCGTINDSYEKDMAIIRTRLQWILLLAFLALIFVFPLFPFSSDYLLRVINNIVITVILIHGLNLLMGYAGQVSLGQGAFMAVGAYTTALLGNRFGVPFWLALPASALSAGLVGIIFGAPSLRIKGVYLALATIAAQFIVLWVARYVPAFGGVTGVASPPATIGSVVINSQTSNYYLIVTVAIIMTYFAKNIARSRVGRAFVAIRDNDLAAEVMGISLYRYKLTAFFIGCLFAGIAGALWANLVGHVQSEQFPLLNSIWYTGIIMIGGMGYTLGAIIGTFLLLGVQEIVTLYGPALSNLPGVGGQGYAGFSQFLMALVIMLFIIFEPRGLAHRWQIFKTSYRLHPFSY
ncbi:MAG: branched-chain amino acid ABC transporter permease [Chloroflexi bacterium]|nr:branched-chain amino acid ABC transporter permease [Chloroflexota bacterium]